MSRSGPRGVLASLPTSSVLDRLFAGAPVGMALVDRELRYLRVNPALARMNQHPVDAHVGRTPQQVLGPVGQWLETLLQRVLDTGEPVLGLEVPGAPGRGTHYLASYAPVLDERGRPVGVVAVVQDVTQRREAEAELQRSLERVTRLQRVTAALSAALTVDAVAEVIVTEAMAAVGASCGVLALRGDERCLVIRHRFGMGGANAPGILPLDARIPLPEAVHRRAPVVLASRSAWLERYPDIPPRGDFEAFAALPLLFEDVALGAMGLGLPSAGAVDAQDVSLLQAIARQGAQALERARLYDERSEVARTLQRGLLPGRLPAVAGMELAARYRPVAGGSEVGGDFYDVVELDDGRWLATVGDVSGKGVEAAALSGLVRSAIGAIALQTAEPERVLEVANRAIRRNDGDNRYATAVVVTLHAQGDTVVATIGAAGHPPALLRRAGGGVEAIETSGLMLGVADTVAVRPRTVRLELGDVLVLHTDGITDGRVAGERFGDDRVRAALEAAGPSAHDAVRAIGAAVEAWRPGPASDDEAILAVRVTGS